MKRRFVVHGLMGGVALALIRSIGLDASSEASTTQSAGDSAGRPIQLHLDLAVDPAKEQEMLENFETVFRPAASRQPGFIDLKMLKLQSAIRGPVPAGGRYRFVLTFASEELRQQWIASADHDRAWPTIENTLTDKDFGILLYDVY